jgi:uncharacterized protein with HEPN domain
MTLNHIFRNIEEALNYILVEEKDNLRNDEFRQKAPVEIMGNAQPFFSYILS